MALGIIQNMPDTEVIPEFPEWQDQYVGMEAKLKEVPKIPDEYGETKSKKSIEKLKNGVLAPESSLESNLERAELDEDINLQKYPKPKGEKNPV